VSELRSVVDQLRADVLAELPDARVEEEFIELHRALEQLEAERLRRLADIERRGVYARDGYLSAAPWLVSKHGVSWGTARADVRVARAIEEMAKTKAALDAGDVSLSAVKVLAFAREADPDAFADGEARLVQAARVHSVGDLQKVATYWRQRVEREQLLEADERVRVRRRLHASVTFGGMVRLDGDLDPESGETLLTALHAVLDAEPGSRTGEDDRTQPQRRADAITEICRQWLDRPDRPTVAGERPDVTVTVPIGVLSSEGVDGVELDHAGPVGLQTARRIACDASVRRVVLSGRSEPLDVGRSTPVIPPWMRRAVFLRDQHCRLPGCDRPKTWCDAHHAVHWADGGETALPNLMLLCRRHHRLVHERGGFSLVLEDGRPVFRRPDGSVLEDRAPP